MARSSTAPAGVPGFDADPGRSFTLPGAYYVDPAIFEREKRAIFHRSWQYVGHISMLPSPGRYVVRDILDQSVVVLRDHEGALRAFFNVCQHRAHRLLEGEGELAIAITCPYHAWAYDLAGKLRTARGTEGLGGFDRKDFGLKEVRLAERLGFLFVNLDGRAPDFATVADPMFAEVAAYAPDAARLQCAERREYPLKANWKNSIENFDECFHCPTQHPTLIASALDYESYRITVHEHHHSHYSRNKGAAMGYGTRTEGAARPDEFGSWLLWPNWAIEAYPGGNLTVFHHVPLTTETMVQRCEWYFPQATPTPAEQEVIDYIDIVRREDIPICESVQSGLHSLGYRQGRFVVDPGRTQISEHAVHDFQRKVLRALEADD